MAAFIVGKSLKDRRQTKAMAECFDLADKNGNGKISVAEYARIFSEHGISIDPEELAKLCGSTNSDVQVTKEEFMSYAKHSEFFKNQLDKSDSSSMVNKRESAAKAERAFKLFDKDNDGYITKVEFQKISEKLDKSQIDAIYKKFDKDNDGVLSLAEFKKMMNRENPD